MTNTKITMNIDKETKDAAAKVFDSLGMDLSTGIRIYLAQVVRDQELPFTPTLKSTNNQARIDALNGNTMKFDSLDDFKSFVEEL